MKRAAQIRDVRAEHVEWPLGSRSGNAPMYAKQVLHKLFVRRMSCEIAKYSFNVCLALAFHAACRFE